jgi:hypothetical protein
MLSSLAFYGHLETRPMASGVHLERRPLTSGIHIYVLMVLKQNVPLNVAAAARHTTALAGGGGIWRSVT